MPAINLPRLRREVNELVPYCSEPEVFLKKIKDIFDFYGDRTLRPSQIAAKSTEIPAANVPLPVIRQIVSGLTPYANHTPHLILDLSRELWKFGWLEHRLLAIRLVGKLPPSYAGEILQLVETWCLETHDEGLITAIADRSLIPLHSEHQDSLIAKAEEWIDPSGQKPRQAPAPPAASLLNLQKLGLRALLPLLSNQDFQNLPKLFKLLQPLLQSPPKALRPELLELLRHLARRSPQETAFYLRGLVNETPSTTLTWLIRRSIGVFPPDLQDTLRVLVKPAKHNPN